ncbi:LANO_0D05930g1_1 [Lachancea nothofagi CBS 11611]|uniref:HECT-type E3 ubiquitin transferase n=1 Tax=Lachancea nothofagi CBS 11611 TaxID=1266666 RepID=A0A1G4JH25_9SACH|nr:LANO_0D05930g1_1 [Lachancea nothofagi CBS 11611]
MSDSMDRDYDGDGDFVIHANASPQNYGVSDLEDSDDPQEYEYPDEDEVDEREDGDNNSSEAQDEYGVSHNEDGDPEEEAYRMSTDGIDRQAFASPTRRPPASLQQLLGFLSQSMDTHEATRDSHVDPGATTDDRQSRRVDIADIFPEMFGLGGPGHVFSQGRPNGRIAKLLQNIAAAHEDPYMAQESLREISEQLLMMNSLTAERLIPQEELLKNVIRILESAQLQTELELQMISCRCLYNLFEVNPDIVAVAVEHGVIGTLHEKLLEISYIDLAEQVLETLEIVSKLHGREILEAGSLLACLQYLDFFTSHAQKKSIIIVVNSCARIRIQDFEKVADVVPVLKQVFATHTDHTILLKVLDAFYGICCGLRKEPKLLTQLFDFELLQKIMQLIINGETNLETRLKSFDMLSQVFISSEQLTLQVIRSRKVVNLLMSSISDFKKTSKTPLHERIMFVPKSLLTSISRFIAVLLPVEESPVFTADCRKAMDLTGIESDLKQLIEDITPILIEIYINAVDFNIRRFVLVALSRISSSHRPDATSNNDKRIISMIASSFARNKSLFEESEFKDVKSGALLLGCAAFASTLIDKHPSGFLPAFRREGIFELMKGLLEQMSLIIPGELPDERDDNYSHDDEEYSDDSEIENESDDDYNMELDEYDGISQIKPRKMTFHILKRLRLSYVKVELDDILKKVSTMSSKENIAMGELNEIGSLVKRLQMLDVKSDTYDHWLTVWKDVKSKLFSSNFVISSFEFITTGLAEEMSKIISSSAARTSICQRALIDAFGNELESFVRILQSALTRLESFPLIDSGLHGEEGKAASLGKQIKLNLEYEEDTDNDDIPSNLKSIMVTIHCIASFRSLNDFLKHRLLKSQLMGSSVPMVTLQSERMNKLDDWKFDFSFQGTECSHQDTIFGSILKGFGSSSATKKDNKHIWSDLHVVKYRKSKNIQEKPIIGNMYADVADHDKSTKQVYELLILLKALKNSCIGNECFINPKLSSKLACQLDEPLIVSGGALPPWTLHITRHYPFLFPLDIRMFFLQSTSFGYGRLIQIWKNRAGSDKGDGRDSAFHQLGRPTRHKLRISREALFLSSLKILSKYGSSPNILEIEYLDEVGTGLGPTMEFYAMTSKEFTRASLELWRVDDYGSCKKSEFVEGALFPSPLLAAGDHEKTLELFKKLGVFVARSMLDNRILDFRFSRAFFELAHLYAAEERFTFEDKESALQFLSIVDPQLAKSLRFLHVHKDDTVLESLSLTFYLPGYDVELIENGMEIAVTKTNFDMYFSCVMDQVLGSGVEKQIRSFMEGFSQAFPYRSLLILTPDELIELFGRVEEDWSAETLYANVEADHGYTQDSSTVRDLISLMSFFSDNERRLFLQFLTGSPKLPVGGFKSLNPKLTVVRKHTEEDMGPDEYLPSVMTCANYLKLPKYSSKEVLRSRIYQAMNEGSGAFLLS